MTQSPEQFSYRHSDNGCEDGVSKWSLAGERNEGRISETQVGHILSPLMEYLLLLIIVSLSVSTCVTICYWFTGTVMH